MVKQFRTKVFVKSCGTDCKNGDNFYILHRISVFLIGIDSWTQEVISAKIFSKYSIFFQWENEEEKSAVFKRNYF